MGPDRDRTVYGGAAEISGTGRTRRSRPRPRRIFVVRLRGVRGIVFSGGDGTGRGREPSCRTMRDRLCQHRRARPSSPGPSSASPAPAGDGRTAPRRQARPRIDPEGVVQEAYLRARPRWNGLSPKPADLDAWVYRQVLDRLVEQIRERIGPAARRQPRRPLARRLRGALAEYLVDSRTGPETDLSRSERC